MRTFITETLSFILILFIIFLLVVTFNLYRNRFVTKIYISDDVNSVVLGNSHPEVAFNDSLIDGLKNLGHSGESYFYTYYKLKLIIAQNPHINIVYLEFTNIVIEDLMDEWIWEDEFLNFRYPIYGAVIDADGQFLLASNNFDSYVDIVSNTFGGRKYFQNEHLNNKKEFGGFFKLKREKLDSILQTNFEKNDKFSYTNTKLSKENIKYLQKIVEFCKANNIEIKLIRSPQYKALPLLKNEFYFQKIRDSLFNDLEFLDFNDFKLEIDEYGDLDHINFKGAEKFSRYFDEFIKSRK